METTARTGRRTRRLATWQWVVIAMLLIIGTIDYLDRSTLSIGNPLIRRDLHLSVAQMGWLLSGFSWSYAVALLGVGGIIDRFGAKRIVALGALLWSVAQVVTAGVVGFAEFVVMRVFLGIGEAPFFPGGTRATTEWFHIRQRPLAIGAWVSSSGLGPALAAPLLTGIMLVIGWRGMFLSMGIAGLVMVVVWWFVYRRPQEAGLDEEELRSLGEESMRSNATERIHLRDWFSLFRFQSTWGLILGFFGVVYLLWIYLTWLPGYLEIQRHVDVAAAGWLVAIPYTAGFLGYLCGGVVTHQFGRLGLSPIRSSKYAMVLGLLAGGLFTIPGALTSSLTMAIVWISLAEFFAGFPGSMCWTLASNVAPHKYVGSLGSIQDFGGYIGGALAPALTGMIVAATGSFLPALILAAAIAVVSSAAYLGLVRKPIEQRDVDREPAPLSQEVGQTGG